MRIAGQVLAPETSFPQLAPDAPSLDMTDADFRSAIRRIRRQHWPWLKVWSKR